jgi:hypothetical protein
MSLLLPLRRPSTTGIEWTSRVSGADNQWWSTAYGNGLFVSVSGDGTNRVMTSPDGIIWTSRLAAADNIWRSVTYGNGLFVAVSSSGTGNRVMTSPDGIVWTIRASASDNGWRSVTYGNGTFVAVSDNGVGNRVMTSPNGITWTSRVSAADNDWFGLAYGNGTFVATAITGANNRVMTSTNGITWTIRTSAADNAWYQVAFGAGLFVAVSYDGVGNRVMTSPDGVTWTTRASSADNQWFGLTYANGMFVATSTSGTDNRVMTSGSFHTSVGVSKDNEVLLASDGLTDITFGDYMNGLSFQQEGIVTFNNYQYAAYWNTSRHVVIGRRLLPTGTWSWIELTDYTNTINDSHNDIVIGICPGDGTLHLSFDHHDSDLHYRKTIAGVVTNPNPATWVAASFSPVTSSLVTGVNVTVVTYPKFITEPGGLKMLFECRIGISGSGDEYLWEYDSASHTWISLGMFINGTIDSVNAYPHGLSYTKGGPRLHLTWCWRETDDASTNHDLCYIYSDDHGRTWKNNAGTTVAVTGTSYVRKSSTGITVWTIPQNRGMINTEHMYADSANRLHVLLSLMPDSEPDDSNFTNARTKCRYFHYWRNSVGVWTRVNTDIRSIELFRGKIVTSSNNNLYAVLPDLRIACASASSNFSDWKVLSSGDSGRFFSDPILDAARIAAEDKLSVFYPQRGSANIYVLDYSLK